MTKDVLVSKTDLAISELVYDKEKLRKSYNYYNCKRDQEQFKYLEDKSFIISYNTRKIK